MVFLIRIMIPIKKNGILTSEIAEQRLLCKHEANADDVFRTLVEMNFEPRMDKIDGDVEDYLKNYKRSY